MALTRNVSFQFVWAHWRYISGHSLIRCLTSVPSMPPCHFKPEQYNGISYDGALKIRKANLSPAIMTYYKKHIMVHQGHMQWLWDTDGKRYLDLFAGIVTVSVGHCHPVVTERAHAQLDKLWHTTNIYMHPTIHEYAEKLVAKFPGDLKVAYFVNSGSEANDLAILMARMYTGVFDVISLRNGYHGMSPYQMGVTALSNWRFNVPSGFGVHQAVNPDPFQGPWGGARCRDSLSQTIRSCDCQEGECHASDMYVDQLEDVLRFSMPKGKVGAFISEAIQGVGGAVQFPKNYLKRAFQMIQERGGLCISDEVQTGFGRLGTHFWGFESHDVLPDIVTLAKGMGNGFPLAAVVTTPEIAKTMGQALHFNTYGGNPMSCAVGSSVLDVIDKDNIQQNSHVVGSYIICGLKKVLDDFDFVGDVRGKGLMIGMEMVTDKKSRKPMSPENIAVIWEDMKDMGVLVGKGGLYGTSFRIKPPMCVTKADADFGLAVIRRAMENFEAKQ